MIEIASIIHPGFTKEDRAGFAYFFAHWCAFNMTALNLKCWKFKYLFHDIEKPWLKLILRDYSKVQKIHRKRAKHHLTYGEYHGYFEVDYEAMVIDWECSRYTKQNSQLTAFEEYQKIIDKFNKSYTDSQKRIAMKYIPPVLKKLELWHESSKG